MHEQRVLMFVSRSDAQVKYAVFQDCVSAKCVSAFATEAAWQANLFDKLLHPLGTLEKNANQNTVESVCKSLSDKLPRTTLG
jgi:hypothetical protein